MKTYLTELRAINPRTGELTTFCGQNVRGISMLDAQVYCERHGLGYLTVIGELVAEIPCKEGTEDPDWDNMLNFDNITKN